MQERREREGRVEGRNEAGALALSCRMPGIGCQRQSWVSVGMVEQRVLRRIWVLGVHPKVGNLESWPASACALASRRERCTSSDARRSGTSPCSPGSAAESAQVSGASQARRHTRPTHILVLLGSDDRRLADALAWEEGRVLDPALELQMRRGQKWGGR